MEIEAENNPQTERPQISVEACWYHRRHHLEEDPLEGAEEEAVEV
jgi:tetrahydromethanopterin S-methyltransferase subunit F